MALIDKNLTGVAPSEEYTLIPKGWYKSMMVDSGVDEKENGMRQLRTKWEILEGPQAKRMHGEWITLDNPRGKTYAPGQSGQEIGDRLLKSIALSVKHPTPDNVRQSEDLHNRPVWIKIDTKPAKDGYPERNRIETTRSLDDPPKDIAEVSTAKKPPQAPVGSTPTKTSPTPGKLPLIAANGAGPKTPPKKPPTAPPAKPKPEPILEKSFWVVSITGETTGDVIAVPHADLLSMVKDGYTGPVMLDGDEDWHDAAHYGIVAVTPPDQAPATGMPWMPQTASTAAGAR